MRCQICAASCRSKCAKCGTALCARHKPKSTRAKCICCPRSTRKAGGAAPVAPTLTQSTLLPTTSAPLSSLTLTEQLAWIADRRARLHQKQARERDYLDRRAARGTHTPTDDAYEADAILENDLFEALDLLEQYLQGSSPMGGSPTYTGTSFLFADPDHHAKLQP